MHLVYVAVEPDNQGNYEIKKISKEKQVILSYIEKRKGKGAKLVEVFEK